ncbi:MAG: asparaginase [Paludibacteraceae bacterium]
MESKKNVLLIFTGGTVSMSEDPTTGALRPIDFKTIQKMIPELGKLGIETESLPFLPLIDSSDVNPDIWERIALSIEKKYELFDGFVVLHGTDTMSYSASALSFMLENLRKPVIFTGAQLPIGKIRTDAKENLITAIEIAAAKNEIGNAVIPEVCIFFEDTLFRANRTTKQNTEHFNAFASFNYPHLAKAGVRIKYFTEFIHYPKPVSKLRVRTKIDRNVAILKIFPGITEHTVSAFLNIPKLKGVVLETFGAGNAPRKEWFVRLLKNATDRGIVIVNKTQCSIGSVEMGRYETSLDLIPAGVISGYDSTTETLITKMMYLLGENDDIQRVRHLMSISICGEMTIV